MLGIGLAWWNTNWLLCLKVKRNITLLEFDCPTSIWIENIKISSFLSGLKQLQQVVKYPGLFFHFAEAMSLTLKLTLNPVYYQNQLVGGGLGQVFYRPCVSKITNHTVFKFESGWHQFLEAINQFLEILNQLLEVISIYTGYRVAWAAKKLLCRPKQTFRKWNQVCNTGQ